MSTKNTTDLIKEGQTLAHESIDSFVNEFDNFRYKNCTIAELSASHSFRSLVIRDSNVGKITIDCAQVGSINIINSQIDEFVVTGTLDSEIIYFDKEIDKHEKSIGRLFVSNKSVIKYFSTESCVVYYFGINNSKVQKLVAENSFFTDIRFEHLTGAEIIELKDCKIAHFFNFNYCAVLKLDFFHCVSENIDVMHSRITEVDLGFRKSKAIALYNITCDKLKIQGGVYSDLSIVLGTYNFVKFYARNIELLFIGSGYRNSPNDRLYVGVLDFSHYAKTHSSRVKINDIVIKTFDLKDFDNHDTFEVSNAEIESCRFILTRLGKSVFNSINFQSIVLKDSIIHDSVFANILWPKRNMIHEFEKEQPPVNALRKNELYVKLAESYRQLKILCLKGNDKYNALAFHGHEMNQIWKSSNINRRNDLGNWLILGSDKLFSDFGQSLRRPLFWLFGVHTVLFIILLINFNLGLLPATNMHSISLESTVQGIGMYLNLINPVHATVINGESIFGISDFFMRLSAGCFIYYFIRVTRKYSISV